MCAIAIKQPSETDKAMSGDRAVSGLSALKPSLLKFKLVEESPEPAKEDYSFKGSSQESGESAQQQQTPSKKESLKQAIINRVSASKKSKKGRLDQGQLTKAFVVQEDLKEVVINFQSSHNEGYYSFSDWLRVNELIFGSTVSKSATELWKILRLVNFGEVAIPTGLIYEVLAIIKSKAAIADKQHQLVTVINNFLEVNQLRSSFYTLKELNNYKPLAAILQFYEVGDPPDQNQVIRKPDPKIFEDLYQDAKTRSEKKAFKCLAGQREELKDCTFVPYVSYYPLLEGSTSRCSKTKRCAKSAQKYRKQPELPRTEHKAKPIHPSLFETPPVASIWGVEEHIRRTVGSYNERLKLKRMIQKPVVLKLPTS